MVTASEDGTARIWNHSFAKILKHEKRVSLAAYCRKGDRIVTVGGRRVSGDLEDRGGGAGEDGAPPRRVWLNLPSSARGRIEW